MSEPPREPDCFYRLDADDRITAWGGPQWACFARENGDSEWGEANIGGRSIYDFVAGHFTKRFLREFFAGVRLGHAPTRRAYRCDSPSVKRLMEMEARPEAEGAMVVEHRLVEQRAMAHPVTTREQRAGHAARYHRCAMCNRLRAPNTTKWREPDETFDQETQVMVIHTVCADCRRGASARLPLRASA